MRIVPCENGVGEWEIDPTHETFDTYAEAEEQLHKGVLKMKYEDEDIFERLFEKYYDELEGRNLTESEREALAEQMADERFYWA